jgi:hypothetical protein
VEVQDTTWLEVPVVLGVELVVELLLVDQELQLRDMLAALELTILLMDLEEAAAEPGK